MVTITSTDELKSAISLLETEQRERKDVLRAQFRYTLESFKPTNLVLSTISNMASSPGAIDTVLASAVSLGVGYLVNRRGVAATGTILTKIIKPLIQVGITSTVAKHSRTVLKYGRAILGHYLHKTSK